MRSKRGVIHFLYIWFIVGLAVWQLYLLFPALDIDRGRELLAIILLGVLAEWLSVPFPHGQLSGGFTLVLSTFLIFGPAAAAWVSGLSAVLGQGTANRGNPMRTTIFNACQYVLAVVAAGHVFELSGGEPGLAGAVSIFPLVAFTVCYIVINHLLVYFYLLPKRLHFPHSAWQDAVKWDGLTYLFTIPLGLLTVMVYNYTGLTGILMLFSSVLAFQFILRYYIRLQVTNRELTAFYDVAMFIEKNPKPAEVLNFILKSAGRAFSFHTGVAYLHSGERDTFMPAAVSGPFSRQLHSTAVYRGEGIFGQSLTNREPEIIFDSRTDPRTRNEAGLCQVLRSLLIIPLLSGKESLGVIVLGEKRPMAFDEKHLHIMTILGRQAAITVENSVLTGRLEHIVSRDALTGFYNSGTFYKTVSEICESAGESGAAAGLIIIDVDQFGIFNERYGRPAGDWLLAELAGIIEGEMRGDDIVSRCGGDEFALLLPGACGHRLLNYAENIREEIRGHYFLEKVGRQARITVSIGVAEFPRDAGDAAGLFKATQRALEKAKKDGRDQVAAAAVSIIGAYGE
ncbi:MAG: Phytochrome-like protein cph2 [Pelotomaculum sp. PtaU1.Bin035]|nr:MAG: Phytochrome-like protein cph2 [Pelotomaculum sp. PtaU1.Bin035]